MSRYPGTSAEPSLLVRGLSVAYPGSWIRRSRIQALKGLDLEVPGGEVRGIVGPNGSGKTSLFRALLGLVPAGAGTLRVLGAGPGHAPALRRIGYMAEEALPFGRLSPRELLTLAGTLRGMARREAGRRAEALCERVGLASVQNLGHGCFSKGMSRKLSFAQALLGEPELLLLDEPTAGMDPLGVLMIREAVSEHAARGGTCLIATHGLEDFDGIFDRLQVLLEGRTVAEGSPGEVLGRPGTLRLVLEGEGKDWAGLLEKEGARILERGPARKSLGSFLAEIERRE